MKKYFILSAMLCMLLSGCSELDTTKTDSQDTTVDEMTTDQAAEAVLDTDTESQRSWQDIYADFIKEDGGIGTYKLLFIDDNAVPELLMEDTTHYGHIYTIVDGECTMIHGWADHPGMGTYYEGVIFDCFEHEGILLTWDKGGTVGFEAYRTLKLENGEFSVVDEYTVQHGMTDTGNSVVEYTHNGNPITEEEYNQNTFDSNFSMEGFSYKEILSILVPTPPSNSTISEDMRN